MEAFNKVTYRFHLHTVISYRSMNAMTLLLSVYKLDHERREEGEESSGMIIDYMQGLCIGLSIPNENVKLHTFKVLRCFVDHEIRVNRMNEVQAIMLLQRIFLPIAKKVR
jgi:hypothetical protein